MAEETDLPQTNVFQMKVTLNGIEPAIWRRFQVLSNLSFYEFHLVLQAIMGWANAHLYLFKIGNLELSDPVTAEEFGVVSADGLTLGQLLAPGMEPFTYEYDFGDAWQHEIAVEKVLHSVNMDEYPLCLGGQRACPPEDCGGVLGYASFLTAVTDPAHPKRGNLFQRVGGLFDPEAFDANSVNQRLKDLHLVVGE